LKGGELVANELSEIDAEADRQDEWFKRFQDEVESNPPVELVQPAAFPSTVIQVMPEPMTALEFIARAERYGNAARGAAINAGRRAVLKQAQVQSFVFEEERRVHYLPLDRHNACKGCKAESSKGWQPIGTLLEIGDCECMGGCDCYFEWRDSQGGVYVSPWGRHNPKGYNTGGAAPGAAAEGKGSAEVVPVAEAPASQQIPYPVAQQPTKPVSMAEVDIEAQKFIAGKPSKIAAKDVKPRAPEPEFVLPEGYQDIDEL
jgi:hypothetical protein